MARRGKSLKRIRDTITSTMDELGLYEDADQFMVEAAAQALKTMYDTHREMLDKGAVQKFKNGTRQVSPEWVVWRNAINDFKGLASELGLSPKARKAIQDRVGNNQGGPAPDSGISRLRKQLK